MGGRGRHLVLLGALTGVLALVLGAAERGAAETLSLCSDGKPICATVTDPAQASRSPVGTDHYMKDSVTVFYDSSEGATSKLVNLTVTVTWEDVGAPTTSVYKADFSDPDCIETGTQTLTCTTPKSLEPGDDPLVFDPLVFRTATTTADPDDQEASATKVTVTAAAKEQTKPSKGGSPPNSAFVTVPNSTPYEGNPDQDFSEAGEGISTTLATAQVGQQFSELPVPANADRGLFELSEADTCPAGFTCFGQQVTTVTIGLSPVNLQITYTGPLPPGATEKSIVVLHILDDGTRVTISAACSGALFSGQPPSSEIPCRRVRITRLPGGNATVEIDAWDITNGQWSFG